MNEFEDILSLTYELIIIKSNGNKSIKKYKYDTSIIHLTCIKIKEIYGLEQFIQLIELTLTNNDIDDLNNLHGLTQLINLQRLILVKNKLTKLINLNNLTKLKNLFLCDNNICNIDDELNNLVNLEVLKLNNNQLNNIDFINKLINLHELHILNTKIVTIPFTVLNLRNLYFIRTDVVLNDIIQRFINKNKISHEKSIYYDTENIHDTHLNKSVTDSIYAILDNNLKNDKLFEQILNDDILINQTKE